MALPLIDYQEEINFCDLIANKEGQIQQDLPAKRVRFPLRSPINNL